MGSLGDAISGMLGLMGPLGKLDGSADNLFGSLSDSLGVTIPDDED